MRLRAAWALALLCERDGLVAAAAAATEYERHHAGLRLARLVEWALRCMSDSDKVLTRITREADLDKVHARLGPGAS